MMKLPYGISDFEKMRKEDYLYIDKTNFIQKIEELSSNYLFFIRPRRFGKSLFLSTLANYYDLNNEDKFDELYGDLYIGKNPTKLKTDYIILKLNFSGLNTDDKEKLRESFRLSLVNSIKDSLNYYQDCFDDVNGIKDKLETTSDIKAVFEYFLKAVKQAGEKIYLIIDEYDHFANDIIAMGDSDFYRDIIRATGFVRDFYETVKIGT
ncbi:MAG: AAA family ATPase, partial [Halanaerobiales bacterium]